MERKRPGTSKTPAPIFSKKPRQALLAHPNNSNSINDQNGSYIGRNTSKSGGTNNQRSAFGQSSLQQYDLNTDFNRIATGAPHYQQTFEIPYQNENGSMRTQNRNYQSCSATSNKRYSDPVIKDTGKPKQYLPSHNRFGASNGNNTQKYDRSLSAASTYIPGRATGYHENRFPQNLPQASQMFSSNATNFPQNLHSNSQLMFPPEQQRHQQIYNGFVPPGHGQPPNYSPARGCQPYGNPIIPEPVASRKVKNVPTRNEVSSDVCMNHQSQQQIGENQASSAVGSKEFKIQKKETENSLRMVTSTIQGMKQWIGCIHKMPIIFEIYGVLNSAVTSSDNHASREFYMKDDREVLKCKFYQIDRPLHPLTRGQWYRCTGKWSNNEESLLCLSVRPALDEERKVYRLRINASDRALRAWKLKNSEF